MRTTQKSGISTLAGLLLILTLITCGTATPSQEVASPLPNATSASPLVEGPEPISAEVSVETGRNAENRLRINSMQVVLTLGQPAAALQHLDRALAQFEDFCTVTQSVRAGIEVNVQVLDAQGARLK